MDSTPEELIHYMHKEMQTNKKGKYTIPWLLLSVIAKMKLKESAGFGLNTKPSSDLDQSELGPPASKLSHQGKNYAVTIGNTSKTSGQQECCQCRRRVSPRNYRNWGV